MRKLLFGLSGMSAATALTAALMSGPPAGAVPAGPDLAEMVTLKDVQRHLRAFQEIADYNGGNRAAGRPGYDVSVKYVLGRLRAAGFTPAVQRFAYPYWRERTGAVLARPAPHPASYAGGRDFVTMLFSGSGDVTGPVTAVDVPRSGAGSSGCQAADFAGFAPGSIALLQRGSCTFAAKVARARAAGASAVLIFNTAAARGPVNGTVSAPQPLPVLGPSHRVGAALVRASRRKGGLWLRVRTDTRHGTRHGANVVADTREGAAGNVVLLGAHLDSVAAGPGINDNATGAAALLAIARRIGALGAKGLRNRVRFAWWGAEEEGLRGSAHYVRTLPAGDRARIALNLNADMLGSVNGVRGVYDGDGSRRAGARPPAGSGAIERLFRDHFARRRLPVAESPLDGRSDYAPFLAWGIPAGGLATGADGVKSEAEARTFGGVAGASYDPCYHARCDRMANVDLALLDTNVDALASVTQRLAAETLAVNGQAGQTRGEGAGAAEWSGNHRIR